MRRPMSFLIAVISLVLSILLIRPVHAFVPSALRGDPRAIIINRADARTPTPGPGQAFPTWSPAMMNAATRYFEELSRMNGTSRAQLEYNRHYFRMNRRR